MSENLLKVEGADTVTFQEVETLEDFEDKMDEEVTTTSNQGVIQEKEQGSSYYYHNPKHNNSLIDKKQNWDLLANNLLEISKRKEEEDVGKFVSSLEIKLEHYCQGSYSSQANEEIDSIFDEFRNQLFDLRALIQKYHLENKPFCKQLYAVACRYFQLEKIPAQLRGMSRPSLLKYAALFEGKIDWVKQKSQRSATFTDLFKSTFSFNWLLSRPEVDPSRLERRDALVPYDVQRDIKTSSFTILQKRKVFPLIGKGRSKIVKAAIYIPKETDKEPEISVESIIHEGSKASKEVNSLILFSGAPSHVKAHVWYTYKKKDGTVCTCIILERYEGNLWKIKGQLGLKDQIQVALDACTGIYFMHTHGYAHCDIKPDNILFRQVGGKYRAYICDYDCIETFDHLRKNPYNQFWYGTPLYTAPEVWTEGRQDITACECYALGLSLLFMSGLFDSEGKQLQALITEHQNALMQGRNRELISKIQHLQVSFFEKVIQRIRDENDTSLKEYLHVLVAMIQPDPKNRPKLEVVLRKLAELRDHK